MSEFSKLYTKAKLEADRLEVQILHPTTPLQDKIDLCTQKLKLIEECKNFLRTDATMDAYTISGFREALIKQIDAILKQRIKYEHQLSSLNNLIK